MYRSVNDPKRQSPYDLQNNSSTSIRFYSNNLYVNGAAFTIIDRMVCEICGNEYTYYCPHCTKRINTWGREGLACLMELAKSGDDIQSMDLVKITKTYYIGKARAMSDKVNVLRAALRGLGYKGKFAGRISRKEGGYWL